MLKKKKSNSASITISLILIIVGIAIIISYYFEISYWSIMPALVLLIIGIWGLFSGIKSSKEKPKVFYFGPSRSSYIIGWSSIITIAGILFLTSIILPDISSIIYLGLFIILVGLISLVISVIKTDESGLDE